LVIKSDDFIESPVLDGELSRCSFVGVVNIDEKLSK